MSQVRAAKVGELMKHEVSQMILNELKDPRIGFVTVTKVSLTGDLREAKIYVSLMGTDEEKKASLEGLNHSLGFMRTELSKRIRLRYMPKISLCLDQSMDYSANIQALLNKVASGVE